MYDTSLPVRQRLKLATAAAHSSLEARIGPLTTQTAYNEYLRGLHTFRSAVENWLAVHKFSCIGHWRSQNIERPLHDDMNDLALKPLRALHIGWASNAGGSFAMGVHYVLEGSALGARVLCKQVEALGLHRGYGARHLWAQAETLDSWRGYLDVLNTGSGDEAALIAGANATFNAAAGAMERAAHV